MISQLTSQELTIFKRGIILLVAIIVFGVVAAEYQINSLTLQHNNVQAFNIKYDTGKYIAYVFGNQYPLSAVQNVGKIEITEQAVELKINTINITLPLLLRIDISEAILFLEQCSRQFTAEAIKTKKHLQAYVRLIVSMLN